MNKFRRILALLGVLGYREYVAAQQLVDDNFVGQTFNISDVAESSRKSRILEEEENDERLNL